MVVNNLHDETCVFVSIDKSLDTVQKGLRNEKITTPHIETAHREEKQVGVSAVLPRPWCPQLSIHTALLSRDSKQARLNVCAEVLAHFLSIFPINN